MAENAICNCKMFTRKVRKMSGEIATMALAILTQDFCALPEEEVQYLAAVTPLEDGKGFSMKVLEEIPGFLCARMSPEERKKREVKLGANSRVYLRKQRSHGQPVNLLMMTVDDGALDLPDEMMHAVRVQTAKTSDTLCFTVEMSRPAEREFRHLRADQIFCQM